jgi:hypothetical protein
MYDPTDTPNHNARLVKENNDVVFVPMTRNEMFFVLDCVRADAYRKNWPPQHQAFEKVILAAIEELDDEYDDIQIENYANMWDV